MKEKATEHWEGGWGSLIQKECTQFDTQVSFIGETSGIWFLQEIERQLQAVNSISAMTKVLGIRKSLYYLHIKSSL